MKSNMAVKGQRLAFAWKWGYVPAIVLGTGLVLMLVVRVGSFWFPSLAYAQEEGARAVQPNPLMPPQRELQMKIKSPFTVAGVGDIILRNPMGKLADPGFLDLIKHLQNADVGVADMEGTLLDLDNFPNPINGGAPRQGLEDIKSMGIRMMLTANNHSMEDGVAGMLETIRLLDEGGIAHAGTGKNLQEARAASFYDTPKGIVGIVGVFPIDSHSRPDPASTSGATYQIGDRGGRPGVNGLHVTPYYVVTAEQFEALRKIRDSAYARRNEIPDPEPPVSENGPKDRVTLFGASYQVGPKVGDVAYEMNPGDLKEILRSIRNGKEYSDFMIVTVHCHQANYAFQQYSFDNDTPPFLVDFAHKAIDAGADEFIGTGVHTIRAVEIYKGKPIFYDVSNFVYQLVQSALPQNPGGNMTDAEDAFRPGTEMDRVNQSDNLENLLAESHFENGRLVEIRIYPGDLGQDKSRSLSRLGIPMTPSPEMAQRVLEKLQRLSKPFGTNIIIEKGVGVVRVSSEQSEGAQLSVPSPDRKNLAAAK